MKLHQIKYSGYGKILFRDVSCVCSEAEANLFSKTTNAKFKNETETKHEKSKDTKKEEMKPVQTMHQPNIIGDSPTRKALSLRNVGRTQTKSDV
ncbi:hypothetical protein ACJMK2_004584 [Sinanodonta woodiana]|uniref:Uncharacterized protein n=1 Tax=Sinanodonta woodiana TaxID=1069815 RepID=A0ABD3Y1P3_SINWO